MTYSTLTEKNKNETDSFFQIRPVSKPPIPGSTHPSLHHNAQRCACDVASWTWG